VQRDRRSGDAHLAQLESQLKELYDAHRAGLQDRMEVEEEILKLEGLMDDVRKKMEEASGAQRTAEQLGAKLEVARNTAGAYFSQRAELEAKKAMIDRELERIRAQCVEQAVGSSEGLAALRSQKEDLKMRQAVRSNTEDALADVTQRILVLEDALLTSNISLRDSQALLDQEIALLHHRLTVESRAREELRQQLQSALAVRQDLHQDIYRLITHANAALRLRAVSILPEAASNPVSLRTTLEPSSPNVSAIDFLLPGNCAEFAALFREKKDDSLESALPLPAGEAPPPPSDPPIVLAPLQDRIRTKARDFDATGSGEALAPPGMGSASGSPIGGTTPPVQVEDDLYLGRPDTAVLDLCEQVDASLRTLKNMTKHDNVQAHVHETVQQMGGPASAAPLAGGSCCKMCAVVQAQLEQLEGRLGGMRTALSTQEAQWADEQRRRVAYERSVEAQLAELRRALEK